MNLVFDLGLKVVAAIVMICVLVVVHELGHYLVARLFRIGTPVFSIGMGPRLFGFRALDTDFRVSALPIGGYVRMSGADPFGEEDPDDWCPPEQHFMRKPVWQRLLVMLAGPGMNLALPVVLFTAAFMLGRPVLTATFGTILPETPAAELGLRVGDAIIAVDGVSTGLFADVDEVLRARAGQGQGATLTVTRGADTHTVSVPASALALGLDGRLDWDALGALQLRRVPLVAVVASDSPAGRAGLATFDYLEQVDGQRITTFDALTAALAPGAAHEVVRVRMVRNAEGKLVEERATVTLTPDPTWQKPAWATYADAWGIEFPATYVGSVEGGSAASTGVRPGDRIIAIDQEPVQSWREILVTVSGSADGGTVRSLTLHLIRDGVPVGVTLLPRVTTDVRGATVVQRPIMGVKQLDVFAVGETRTKFYGFGEAVQEASGLTMEGVQDSLKMIGNLVTGRVAVTRVMGGPVQIVYQAGAAAESGWFAYVSLMALLSLSLGIINLMPVPLLDGGQIVFYTIEGIRGRPVPQALRDQIQMVGALALVALLVVVTIGDVSSVVSKLFTG